MLDIDFQRPGTFHPGDLFTCNIDVQSMFKIKCKYVKVRLRCPYHKDLFEEFRIYEIANRRITTADKEYDDTDYRVGEKAENIVLQRGRNQFIVKCKIPDVSHDTFEEYSNVIRCSFKVTVNANWLLKRYCLDWFILEPQTTVDEVIDKIENGGQIVLNTVRDRFHRFMKKRKRET